jgi:DNA-binding SARP family transcriptional activator
LEGSAGEGAVLLPARERASAARGRARYLLAGVLDCQGPEYFSLLPKGLIRYDNQEGVYGIDKSIDQWYDARVFTDLIKRADVERDLEEELLTQAISLYQGEYLPPVYSSWCLEQRELYQGMFIRALAQLAEWKAKNKRYDQAAEYYRRALEVEPFQEDFHRGMMQVLFEDGRQIEALQHYEQLVALLDTELGLLPAKETQALFDQIQRKGKSVA